MNRGNKCGTTKVELVHKQITPVPAKSLYEEAIARGEFIGTFAEYQEFMRRGGELFLVKDTVAQLRGLTAGEILHLKAGVYKGIRLLGYYKKGDTPASIDYYLYNGSDIDDGGSVFEVGGIKLEHDFGGLVDVRYFGVFGFDSVRDTTTINYILKKYSCEINLGGKKTTLTLGSINVVNDNTKITSEGCRIINSKGITDYTLFKSTETIKHSFNISIQLNRGQYILEYENFKDKVSVNDILILKGDARYTDPITNGNYNHGLYTQIEDIKDGKIILKFPSLTDFLTTSVDIVKPLNNIEISNLNIHLDDTVVTGGINLSNVVNSKICNNNISSVRGVIGIGISGINVDIFKNNVKGFNNNEPYNTGYGIGSSGHNINIYSNNINKGKHCIASATRQWISSNINYRYNTCSADFLLRPDLDKVGVIDMHSNIIGGSIIGNTIIGKDTIQSAIGMRASCINIEDNKIYINKTSTSSDIVYGIFCFEMFDGNCTFKNNVFNMYAEPNSRIVPIHFGVLNGTVEINNLSICGNTFNQGSVSLYGDTVGYNINIYENNFDTEKDNMLNYISINCIPKKLNIFRNRFVNKSTNTNTLSIDTNRSKMLDMKTFIDIYDNDVISLYRPSSGRFVIRSIYNNIVNNRLITEFNSDVISVLYQDGSTLKSNYFNGNIKYNPSTETVQQLLYINDSLPPASEFFIDKSIKAGTTNTGYTIKEYRCEKTSSSYKWIDVNTNQSIGVLLSGSTLQRPILSNVVVGFKFFDTDLGKPIYKKDNTTWVDSNGETV